MAQLVLGVAGAVIGGMFGMPSVGWAIGSAVGSAFAPTQKSHGPKLSDLKVTASEYGGSLHILEGHPRVAGVVAWSSDKHEIATTTEQGKGGGAESTSYTYECDCFMLLSDAEILGIRRIWSNGKLIWSIADDSDEETIEASEDTTKWKAMRMYSGAADQLPDPVYEAAVGVGNAPAYRGRGGVFFEGLSLGSGGVMPNLTFEVNANVSENETHTRKILSEWAQTTRAPHLGEVPQGAATADVKMTVLNKNEIRTYSSSSPLVRYEIPSKGNPEEPGRGNGDKAIMVLGNNGGALIEAGFSIVGDGITGIYISLPSAFSAELIGTSEIRFSTFAGKIAVGSNLDIGGIPNYQGRVFLFDLSGTYIGNVATGASVVSIALSTSKIYIQNSAAIQEWDVGTMSLVGSIGLPGEGTPIIYVSESGGLMCGDVLGNVFKWQDAEWRLFKTLAYEGEDLGTYNALHFSASNGAVFAAVPINLIVPDAPDVTYFYDSAYDTPPAPAYQAVDIYDAVAGWADFWWNHYNELITTSRRGAGLTVVSVEILDPPRETYRGIVGSTQAFIMSITEIDLTISAYQPAAGWYTHVNRRTVYEVKELLVHDKTIHLYDVYRAPVDLTGLLIDANLKEVTERICYKAGLTPDDVDASELADDWVHAFAIPPGSATGAIDQLATGYYFECVESDKLYFRKRGRDTSLTIPYRDLGAESLLSVQDANDLEVPAQVFVKYINVDDSYQSGSEVSDRLTTDSTAISNVELALGFSPDQAKGIADTACLDQQIGSRRLSFAVDRRYSELEPTDVVGVDDGSGSTFRARIVSISDAAGVRNIEAVADDASVLSSTGDTSNNYDPDYTVHPIALTDLVVLDMPILRDVDDGPGVYAAGDGLAGTWAGYALFIEGLQVGTSTTGAAMGATIDVLGTWASGLVDETNSVTVQLNPGDQITSITHDQLTSSIRNYAAIGVHGRWELLQYRSAELIGTGLYRLRGLLRGQLGTEHMVGTHAIGDRFVQLDGAGMLRPAASIADVMTPRDYQGVTMGALVSTAPVQTITNAGVGMLPYAPVNLRQTHDGADILMAWDRRTRYQTNLLTDVVPLGESTEQYQVDIYDGATVVRTTTTSTPTLTYTEAQQVTDFGSAQAAVDVRVYQISASVGRGTPLIYEA